MPGSESGMLSLMTDALLMARTTEPRPTPCGPALQGRTNATRWLESNSVTTRYASNAGLDDGR
jgi:hypothetical protein